LKYAVYKEDGDWRDSLLHKVILFDKTEFKKEEVLLKRGQPGRRIGEVTRTEVGRYDRNDAVHGSSESERIPWGNGDHKN